MANRLIVTSHEAIELRLAKSEILDAATALRYSAGEAYDDERLHTAVRHYKLAARLYQRGGFSVRATDCYHLARVIEQEQLAREAGEDEEADYLEASIRKFMKGTVS